MMQSFVVFLDSLGIGQDVYEKNPVLFREALTHRSMAHEGYEGCHNERLEFLGDAVLELVVTEFLYERFPDSPEGDLTNYRSALVKRENLAYVARKIGLGDFLQMSKAEERSGGREKDYLLANLVEAFLGALYLTGRMRVTKKFVKQFITVELDRILEKNLHIDAKSALQELVQGEFGVTPYYRVISDEGKDHDKTFEMGVFVNDKRIGVGKGGSKKEAQTAAAAEALGREGEWGI